MLFMSALRPGSLSVYSPEYLQESLLNTELVVSPEHSWYHFFQTNKCKNPIKATEIKIKIHHSSPKCLEVES